MPQRHRFNNLTLEIRVDLLSLSVSLAAVTNRDDGA